MLSASLRAASSASPSSAKPSSASPGAPDPRLEKPVPPPPVRSLPALRNPGPPPAVAGNPTPRPPRRGRGRTQRGLVRPRCPEHGGEMLVGRTVGCVQYRYCRVEGCGCAATTFRSDAPHKRWPPANHAAGTRGTQSPNDTPNQSVGRLADGVTVIPQESPVTPLEWPVGRPLPGQSS